MKLPSKLVLLNLLCFTVFPAAADNAYQNAYQSEMSTNIQQLVKYFQNLGNYLGFDVTNLPTQNNPSYTMSYTLINLTTSQLAQTYQFYTLLGSIPVNTFTAASTGSGGGTTNPTSNTNNPFTQFVPSEVTNASTLNSLANNAFPNYNQPASADQVSVSPLIDQPTFQQDPVTQAVLNILGTPDYTFCMDYDAKNFVANCQILYGTLVSNNVVGEIPNTATFFTPTYLQQFLNQLNSNALTAPLMYSNQGLGTQQAKTGLTAQNQEQLAANFIRYVTGSVVPIKLPRLKDYDSLYRQASFKPLSSNKSAPSLQQMQAEQTLAKYLASLRTYAAQNSVGVSNLYYIMSKRMPQTQQSQSQQPTGQMSQALTEYNMATWRLFNPAAGTSGAEGGAGLPPQSGAGGTGQPGNTPWINSLNNAPPATVQKEIAILLAELNYQLYLDRQIHERLLLTNSILLLQSVRTGAPSTDFTSGPQP